MKATVFCKTTAKATQSFFVKVGEEIISFSNKTLEEAIRNSSVMA